MSKPMLSQINGLLKAENAFLAGASCPRPENAPERRRTQRFPLKAKMFLVRVGGLPAAITLKNISCGGASGLMCEPLREGSRLIIELDPRNHVEAEVRWVSRMSIGLKFLTPLEASFVAALYKRHSPDG